MIELKLPVLIFQIVTFLIFVGAMYWALHKPVARLLQQRADKIKADMQAAETARTEADKLRSDYEARLREIELRANEALQKALREGDAARAKMLEEARQETRRMITESNAQMKVDRDKALREMRHDIADLAVLVAERAAKKIVDTQTHQRLIEELTQEVGKL
jgi:F-type H+-transporting ATPase subunit b